MVAPPTPDRTHWQGEPVAVWEALWGVPRVEAWSVLPSTNDRARAAARVAAPPWMVVLAERQTAGRGRGGRGWQSAEGAGLWVSIVLQPRAPAQSALLPLLAGVALARAVEASRPAGTPPIRAGLKWPNDLWLHGRKVAGILCEGAGPERVVAGVGVNLRVPAGGFEAGHAPRAGALEDLAGASWSAPRLLGALLRELRAVWEPPRLRFEGEVARAWTERDILRGRRVRVGAVEGTARGVAADGALEVEAADGTLHAARAGQVEWNHEGDV